MYLEEWRVFKTLLPEEIDGSREELVRIAGLQVEIRIRGVPNTKQGLNYCNAMFYPNTYIVSPQM